MSAQLENFRSSRVLSDISGPDIVYEYAVNLHSHTEASPDGLTTRQDIHEALLNGVVHTLAITDHDTVDMAVELADEFPLNIIPGIEVTTAEGELVILGVRELIPANRTARYTAEAGREQGGLVMYQHPGHKSGLSFITASRLADRRLIDLVETNNGRDPFKLPWGIAAGAFAHLYNIPTVSNGDTHGRNGIGNSVTMVSEMPVPSDMPEMLRILTYHQTRHVKKYAGYQAMRDPSRGRKAKELAA